MRIRFALLLMVAGLLVAAGVATAQTTTDPTGSYTTSTPTGDYTTSTPTTTTTETETETQGTGDEEAAPTTEAATGAAPAVAGTTQQAPENLAFTGAEPLLLIVLGLAAAGGTATLLVRDRRRASQDR